MQRDVLANPLLREMINEDLEMQIENEKRWQEIQDILILTL